MRTKSLILGLCATTVAATGAIAAFASNVIQTNYYVRVGTSIRSFVVPSAGTTFNGCDAGSNLCRVKLITAAGTVLTEATTVYMNSSATTTGQSANALSGTVVLP